MKTGKRFLTFALVILGMSLLLTPRMRAQAPAASGPAAKEKQERGFTLVESFEGSSNADGQIMSFTSAAGYIFSKHFAVDLGIPVDFDRVQTTTTSGTTTTTSIGLGDAFTALHFNFKNPVVNYGFTLTATVPSGDSSKGLSTGRATFNWSNIFSRDFGRWMPFLTAGVGNSLPNTRAFQRPFLTLGKVAHFEAGTSLDLGHSFSISASLYDVAPWGTQKMYSRLVPRSAPVPTGAGTHGRAYQTSPVTSGSADLVRDNGFNAGLDFSPMKYLDLGVAYSRSVHLSLDTFSFGVAFNLSPLFHGGRRR
jgi:hypothetical protein